MIKIPFNNLYHNFDKINLVSNKDGSDTYKCTKCRLQVKRSLFNDYIEVQEKNKSKALYCVYKGVDLFLNKRIKITKCTAQGKQFKNLLPNSIHYIIEPPKEYINDSKGIWVMGVGEPVKVLINEFTFCPLKRTKR